MRGFARNFRGRLIDHQCRQSEIGEPRGTPAARARTFRRRLIPLTLWAWLLFAAVLIACEPGSEQYDEFAETGVYPATADLPTLSQKAASADSETLTSRLESIRTVVEETAASAVSTAVVATAISQPLRVVLSGNESGSSPEEISFITRQLLNGLSSDLIDEGPQDPGHVMAGLFPSLDELHQQRDPLPAATPDPGGDGDDEGDEGPETEVEDLPVDAGLDPDRLVETDAEEDNNDYSDELDQEEFGVTDSRPTDIADRELPIHEGPSNSPDAVAGTDRGAGNAVSAGLSGEGNRSDGAPLGGEFIPPASSPEDDESAHGSRAARVDARSEDQKPDDSRSGPGNGKSGSKQDVALHPGPTVDIGQNGKHGSGHEPGPPAPGEFQGKPSDSDHDENNDGDGGGQSGNGINNDAGASPTTGSDSGGDGTEKSDTEPGSTPGDGSNSDADPSTNGDGTSGAELGPETDGPSGHWNGVSPERGKNGDGIPGDDDTSGQSDDTPVKGNSDNDKTDGSNDESDNAKGKKHGKSKQ